MNSLKYVMCVILSVSAPLSSAAGQNSPDKTPLEPQQADLTREKQQTLDPSVQKILLVLNQVLESQKSFGDDHLRTAIRVKSADMLWAYDEPRARRLFGEALDALAAANLAERTSATSSSRPSAASMNLAFDSIRTVIRRDPAIAAKMGESLVDFPPTPHAIGANGDLCYVLATFLAFEDPRRAAQVAQPFADRGELNKLINIIRAVRRKDAKAADELFFQAFEKARLGEPSIDDIRLLATYVFPGFGEGVITFTSGGGERDATKSIQLSAEVVERFFNLADSTIPARLEQSLAGAEGDRSFVFRFPREYAIARLLAAQFDLFMPDRAQAFRARLEQVRRSVPPDQQNKMAAYEPGTTDELLARADTLSDSGYKDLLYQKAAEQAIITGELGRASVIAEKIVSESVRSNQRQRILDNSSDEIRKSIQAGDFDKAEKMIALISYAPGRAWMFRSLIAEVFQKDQPRALRMLDEARRRVETNENGFERAQELMMLTSVYAVVDTNRAFEAMMIAIEELNRAGLPNVWEKYQAGETTDKNSNSILRVNVGLSALNVSDFELLGRSDFERALVIARQLQMREASVLAQLSVCRGALGRLQPVTPPKPISPAKQQEAGKARQP